MKLLQTLPSDHALAIANDVDLLAFHVSDDDISHLHDWAEQIARAQVIELHFPKFTDGRAFSQAVALRRRYGFKGVLRATGDVLVDLVQHMQRSGFDEAILRADQNIATAQRQLQRYGVWYQGDALQTQPRFAAMSATDRC